MVWRLLLVNDHKNLDIRLEVYPAIPVSLKCFLMLDKNRLWLRHWCLVLAGGITAWAGANYTHPGTWSVVTITIRVSRNNRHQQMVSSQLNHEKTRENGSRQGKL